MNPEHRKNLNKVMNNLKGVEAIHESPDGFCYAILKKGDSIPIGHRSDVGDSDLYDAMLEEMWSGNIITMQDKTVVENGHIKSVVRTEFTK